MQTMVSNRCATVPPAHAHAVGSRMSPKIIWHAANSVSVVQRPTPPLCSMALFVGSFNQMKRPGPVLTCFLVQDATASSAARTQLAELQHNNGILKRAVAIQNNRIQDLLAKEAESQQLKQALLQLQEKCHGLEMNNYSLAMHLKQATDSSAYSQSGQRHPDVY